MGVNYFPDIAKEIMEIVLYDIPDCEVYLDNIGNFSNSWKTPLQVLEQVLQKLQVNSFIFHPLKCKWAVQETDWLWLLAYTYWIQAQAQV